MQEIIKDVDNALNALDLALESMENSPEPLQLNWMASLAERLRTAMLFSSDTEWGEGIAAQHFLASLAALSTAQHQLRLASLHRTNELNKESEPNQ